MTRQTSAVRPPLIAAWLVDLVAPRGHSESIPGDLLEEFSDLAAKSGLDSARRWYWRQSVRTIAHLIGAGFRVAPWTIAGAVVLGYLLRWFSAGLPEQVIVGVLHFRRHHVTPYYTWPQVQTYLFWLNSGIWIGHLLLSLFIGCFVAVVARGSEMGERLHGAIPGPPIRQFNHDCYWRSDRPRKQVGHGTSHFTCVMS